MADKVDRRETSCFTYEVNMVIQVLATSKEEADARLESEGGFVSKREVTFRDSVALYSGDPLPFSEYKAKSKKDSK